jgi:hypothetical protein
LATTRRFFAIWHHHWTKRQADVLKKFDAVAPKFKGVNRSGKDTLFPNWSGKAMRQRVAEVDHLDAYDVFHAELSFAHADAHLADCFPKIRPDGPLWSQRDEVDVGNVLSNSSTSTTPLPSLAPNAPTPRLPVIH